MAKRGRKKKLDTDPCPKGHTAGRNSHGNCRECQRVLRRTKKLPLWLRSVNAVWVFKACRQLRRRMLPGQKRANARQLFSLWLSQNGKCALTGLPIVGAPQLDHVVPTSKGGSHTIDNLQWTHPVANSAKNSHSVEEFRTWLLAAAEALKQKMQLEELL